MSRCYTEPVEVRRRDDMPAQFVWRERLYVVREVLATWVEAGRWWQQAGSLDDCEREYWRVEAAPGRVASPGVYDLCFDWSAGTGSGWTLTRTMD